MNGSGINPNSIGSTLQKSLRTYPRDVREGNEQNVSIRETLVSLKEKHVNNLQDVNLALKIVDSVEGFEDMYVTINRVLNRY